ncbi:MAG TPA: hypothetical protein VGG99_01515 [Acetobacteraceae bacterium]|jgi:hypothetical protein
MRVRWLGGLLLLASAGFAVRAHADDVTDLITKALNAYQAHNTEAAMMALDGAANELRQQRADVLKTFLPLPPPGWTADPSQTSAVSAAMLGGGTSASRTYRNGTEKVDVQITTDSPMLQGMAALIDSPLASASGVKSETVAGRRVSYTQSDNGFMTLVGQKIIVKIDGNKDTPEPDLRTFVAAIDFAELEKFAK